MGDGWETKRRRGAGHDWTVVRFGAEGTIRRVEIDTRHFKGNAPGECSLEAARLAMTEPLDAAAWRELLPRTPLQPDARHGFEKSCAIWATSRTPASIFSLTAHRQAAAARQTEMRKKTAAIATTHGSTGSP